MANENADTANKMLEWNDIKVSPVDVPAVSLMALAQRGFTHVLGNEVAAALTAWRKTEEGKGADDAAIEAWVKDRRQAKLDQIMKGELGVRRAGTGGARVTGFDAVLRRVATEWLTAKLGKLPTGDKTVSVKGKEFTRDELIATAVAKADVMQFAPGVTLRAEAERRNQVEKATEASADELFA